MKSRRSKLLHEVAGRSMLSYAVNAAEEVHPEHLVVVVGHEREQVMQHLSEVAPMVETAVQDQQLGTGHAVQCGIAGLADLGGQIFVTYGDVPLLDGETLRQMSAAHEASGAGITVMTARVPNPTGYGRIVRDGERIARIVEERDATDDERAIDEINSGIYCFDASLLAEGLGHMSSDNAQGELYLTDVILFANRQARAVNAFPIEDVWQTEGVNDRVQLARMNAEMNRRICERWMREGVTIIDPATTWIEAGVDLGRDITILPNTQLQGATSVAAGATIGPDTTLRDVEIGEDATVTRTQGSLAVVGARASVGPFTYLRPGTQLGEDGKIGGFVETKNAVIGNGSKVPHLTYCGDAVLGEGVNVGAGTIFANYDGTNKSTTHLGDHVFIGSNSVLVAPVDIADGAFIAAGSAITDDVTPGSLAVARGKQHVSDGWVRRRRPLSKAAKASEECDGQIHEKVQDSRDKLANVKPEDYK